MTIRRGAVALLIATLALAPLAACASTPSDQHTGTPERTASAPATGAASTVDFGTGPDTSATPSCAQLLPTDLVAALVPGTHPVDELIDLADVSAAWAFPATARGTACASTNGVPTLDEVLPTAQGDPAYEGVRVTVLPDAAADFDAAGQASETADTATTVVRCDASDSARVYCQGGAMAGSAWVQFTATRLQTTADATPEQAEPAFRALLERATTTVAASPLGSLTTDPPAPDGSYTTCSAERVDQVTSRKLVNYATLGTDASSGMSQYAMNRLGAAECSFQTGADTTSARPYPVVGAEYSTVPGGAWVVRDRLGAGRIDRADRLDLPGLGASDGAWRTCDELACSVDVVHDGDWTHYLLYTRVAPNTSDAIERWVESSFSA